MKSASEATGLSFQLPTDPGGSAIDEGKSSYSIEISTKTLSTGDRDFTYFDRGKAVRR